MQYAISLESDEISNTMGAVKPRGERVAQIINRETKNGKTFQKIVNVPDVNGQIGDVVVIFVEEDK